ncbi:MAG: presqualene diphosphate synthase HpnD [Bradyrhizobiaceae bacterium]|nr:presqualene diphosphate synthase HpnD [Bradyrhizobiaceae bacterium]
MNSTITDAGSTEVSASNRAAGSSFYTAMRILPRVQREAMFEIYSFCRRVDDIADSSMPRAERLAGLARWRSDIDALYATRAPAGLDGLATAVRTYSLRKDDFFDIIAGMEMDAVEDIRAPDWKKLDLYCDRVASAVGRLSVCVFGVGEESGRHLAHHLGRALQLTNILRDLDEDAAIGRLYLPREALDEAKIVATEPLCIIASPSLAAACSPVVDRAREHFFEAEAIMARCPRRNVRAPRVMGAVYRAILDGMVIRGWSPPRRRVRLNRMQLIAIVLKYALF